MAVCARLGIIFVSFTNFMFVVSGGGIAVIAMVINSVTIESLVVRVMASRGDSWRTVTLSEPNDALKHITYGAIVIGIFFTVAGLLGCCGSLLPARSMLIANLALIVVLFFFMFTLVILIIQGKPQSIANEQFIFMIRKLYRGGNTTDLNTVLVDHVMETNRCCGLNGYEDFDEAENWARTIEQDSYSVTLMIPPSCCHEGVDSNNCTAMPTSENSYHKTGCRAAIAKNLRTPIGIFIGITSGVMSVQVVCFVVSVILISDMYAMNKLERIDSLEANEIRSGVTSSKILAFLRRIQSAASSSSDSGTLHESKSKSALRKRDTGKSKYRDKSAKEDSETEKNSGRRPPPEFLGSIATWFSEVIDQMATPRRHRTSQPQQQAALKKVVAKKAVKIPPPLPLPAPTPTPMPTPMPTPTPTAAPTPTPTPTPTPAPTPTLTPMPAAETKSVGKPSTQRKTLTPLSSKTPTPVASKTPTPVASKTPTPVASKTPTPVASKTSTPLASKTLTPVVSKTPAPVSSKTPTAVPSKK